MSAVISCHKFKFTVPGDLTHAELEKVCIDLFGYSFCRFERLYQGRDCYQTIHVLSDTGGELVTVYRDGWMRNRGTTCIAVTGRGMELINPDLHTMCQYIVASKGNLCAVDMAFDDFDNCLDWDTLVLLSLADNFKTRVRTKFNRSGSSKTNPFPTVTVQPRRILYGSEKSANCFVIYDRQFVEGVEYPWLRGELRITHREDCRAICHALAAGDDVGPLFAGLLRSRLEFLAAGPCRKDHRLVEPWWNEFLQGVAATGLKRIRNDSPHYEFVPSVVARVRRAFKTAFDTGDNDILAALFGVVEECRTAYQSGLTF
ncbi:MAG: hypothetical protein CXR31_12690 [Geobacter sp.]|nr:MAG: hypothetical protein CXR31_12690 [Geobacter sp.]